MIVKYDIKGVIKPGTAILDLDRAENVKPLWKQLKQKSPHIYLIGKIPIAVFPEESIIEIDAKKYSIVDKTADRIAEITRIELQRRE